jgi:hypothetical protein
MIFYGKIAGRIDDACAMLTLQPVRAFFFATLRRRVNIFFASGGFAGWNRRANLKPESRNLKLSL